MLIVDMPMPKNCKECPAKEWGGACAITKQFEMCEGRPSWCPIKGVLPDEHGDLVDRDAYLKLLESYIESKRGVCENKEFIVALQAISKQIKCVKTVIAAERQDDEQIH